MSKKLSFGTTAIVNSSNFSHKMGILLQNIKKNVTCKKHNYFTIVVVAKDGCKLRKLVLECRRFSCGIFTILHFSWHFFVSGC